jgi:hypothetical protein
MFGFFIRVFIPIYWAIILLAFPVWANPDSLEASFRTGISRTPTWSVLGKQVNLAPGNRHSIFLPKGSSLRLEPVGNKQHHALDKIILSLDNGNGLARQLSWVAAGDGRIGAHIDADEPLIAHLVQPSNSPFTAQFTIAISNTNYQPMPQLYRQEVLLPLQQVDIIRDAPRSRYRYFFLKAGKGVVLDLSGSCRMRMESRIAWSEQESGLDTFHRLSVQVDESPTQYFDSYPGLEHGPVSAAGFPERLLGTKETAFMEIPSGSHQLVFKSNQDLFLRPALRCNKDLLFPQLNGKKTDLSQNPIDELIMLAAANLNLDPARPEGSIQAAQLLRKAAQVTPLTNDLLHAAKRIEGRRTHYRDLLPNNFSNQDNLYAYFPLKKLREPGTIDSKPKIEQKHLRAALNRIPSSRFVPLDQGEKLVYLLPNRIEPSNLRLIVEQSSALSPSAFELDLGSGEVQRFYLFGDNDQALQQPFFKTTVGDVALSKLEASTNSLSFARYRHPAPTLKVGTAIIDLPKSAKQVTLQAISGAAMLRVALQLRVADSPKISESEYLAELERVGGFDVVWQQFQKGVIEEGLLGVWLRPLRRWLDFQEQKFRLNIGPLPLVTIDTTMANRFKNEARQAEKKMDWVTVISSWRRVLASTAYPLLKQSAWNGILDALKNLKEPSIREQILRGLIIQEKDGVLYEQAITTLSEELHNQKRYGRLLSLLAWQVKQNRSTDNINRLAITLNEQGLDRISLIAALLVPQKDRNYALIAKLAFKSGWQKIYLESASYLSKEERNLFSGLAAWQMGEEKKARRSWKLAGTKGVTYLQAMEQGRVLEGGETRDEDLAHWWISHPGPYEWVSPPELIQNFQESHEFTAETSGLSLRMFRASHGKPVTLKVDGPARIKLAIRPSHNRDDLTRISGWASVEVGDKTVHIPITNNQLAQGLIPKQPSAYLPGRAIIREMEIPSGPQSIRVNSDDFTLLVRAWVQRPVFPLANPPHPIGSQPYQMSAQTPIEILEELAWRAEKIPSERAAILLKAESLFAKMEATVAAKSLIQRIRRFSKWQAVESVESSAGVRWLSPKSWLPESPASRIRASLLPPGNPNSRLLAGWNRMVLVKNISIAKSVNLSLSLVAPPFVSLAEITVKVVHVSKKRTILLNSAQPKIVIPLNLVAGEQSITMEIQDPAVGHFLRVGLFDQQGGALPWNLKRNRERLYQAATQEDPLILHVKGPALMRVDEFRDGVTHSNNRSVPKGWQTLFLVPDKGQEVAYYRFFQRQPVPAPNPRSRLPESPVIKLDMEPLWTVTIPDLQKPDAWIPDGKIQDGTWSLDLRRTVRRDAGEGSGSGGGMERFNQLSLTSRTNDENNRTYDQWGLLARDHNRGNETYGAWLEHRDLSPLNPFSWRVRLDAFAQEVSGQGIEASAKLSGGLSRLDHLTPRLDNLLGISGFGSLLSLRDDQGGTVDNDVFSSYRRDHQYGIGITDSLRFRPWLDTLLSVRVGVASNEDLNLLQPERISTRMQLDQLLGNIRLSARYNWQHYLEDADRQIAVNRYGPEMTFAWDFYPKTDDRLELTFNLRREQSTKENIGFFGLTWHFDDKKLKNFSPGEALFRDLRFWSWPDKKESNGNNP